MTQETRMAFVLISFPAGSRAFLEVVSTVNKFEPFLLGSIQVPNPDEKNSLFGLLIKANTDQLGALTGVLGKIKGVNVKSAVLPADKKSTPDNIT